LSNEEALVAAGAECIAGDLILKRRVVGQYRNGVFQVSPAGVVVLEDLQEQNQAEILAAVQEMSEKPRRGRRAPADADPDIGDLK
jgi:hypothetical protein